MNNELGANEFWKDINNDIINESNFKDSFKDFKRNDINYKISIFNPEKNGVRYLKTLIYNLVYDMSDKQLDKLKKLENRNFGNPYTVKVRDVDIDLDYYQALDELSFIEESFDFKESHILEIGAGYGRTPHTILSNHDISSYTIIDLKDTLFISQNYLKEVLKLEQYNKITFLSVEEFELSQLTNFDLTINIDSFAEMDEKVVYEYFNIIDKYSKFFYTKNPVGKYLDKTLDNHSQGKKIIEQALKNGILKDILDIDCDIDIKKCSNKFVSAYLPNNNWKMLSESWAKPFSYYWQVIYKKEGK